MDATHNHSGGPRRSRQSMAFETCWRSLPRDGRLPHKRDFNPAAVPALLRYFMLVEFRSGPDAALPIRVVGDAIAARIQKDIRGQDYMQFLSPDIVAGALDSARQMFEQPCGLWQITPLHFERGIAVNMEVTAFPLLGEPAPFIMVLAVPRDDFLRPEPAAGKAMLATHADEWRFLDVGAGLPEAVAAD
ncbi:MAG: PAS domain-containing protein [Rhizomicrobium sp.]|jgi:hypothetical protein